MAKLLGMDLDRFYIGGIKILHIGYLTIIYILFGFLYAMVIEFIYGDFDILIENKKSIFTQTLELIFMLWFAAVCLFIVNHTARNLPMPSYFKGYDQSAHINELRGAGVLVFLFMFFQSHIFSKLRHNYIRLTRQTDLPNL
jgi:hypothetical protein